MNSVMATMTLLSLLLSCALVQAKNNTFFSQQMKYQRFRTAVAEKGRVIDSLILQNGMEKDDFEIYIRIFKKEKILQLWAKKKANNKYRLIKTYDICSTCGSLGPKRQEGDLQIPEGFYYIDRFNPASRFYLSLGINYPNESDRILGKRGNWGGDIFIHGACVTIGCIPITDDKIKEVYYAAVVAKSNDQKRIPVDIFPTHLTEKNFQKLVSIFANQELIKFWENLQEGYLLFEKTHILPQVKVSPHTGKYEFE